MSMFVVVWCHDVAVFHLVLDYADLSPSQNSVESEIATDGRCVNHATLKCLRN